MSEGATNQLQPRADIQVLAILGFHKIGVPSGGHNATWFYVPEETFAAHLSYLQTNDWAILDLADFLRGLARPRSLPKRTALLTFDDGYRSVLDLALPWLKRFQYPAVVFVPTGFIGGVNSFDRGIEPEEPICDWDALRALSSGGIAVQSHGVSHLRFSKLTMPAQEAELRQSKTLLEAGLGQPVEMLAYPYGDPGTDVAELRRILSACGYRAACLFRGGPNRLPITDRFLLRRVAIGPKTDLDAVLAT